jgi:ubiquinone/menaquinone biosynthesis C-methylase UbiE
MATTEGTDMPPKTRFMIRVPGGTDVGCDTADQVLDALDKLRDTKGVTVADLQTGMIELTREALEELANDERE